MEVMDQDSRNAYPAVHLLMNHGGVIAFTIAALAPIVSLWLYLTGYSLMVMVVGLMSGPLVYLLLRSYVDLVRIMASMLLPK